MPSRALAKGWPLAAGQIGSSPASLQRFSFGPNGTLFYGAHLEVPRVFTAWSVPDDALPPESETLASKLTAKGYNGIQVNLFDGSMTKPNQQGHLLLPTLNPAQVNQQYLDDTAVLLKPFVDRNFIIFLNAVWGSIIAPTSQNGAAKPFTTWNAPKYADWICDGLIFKFFPDYARWWISLIADSHPIIKQTNGTVVDQGGVTRVDVDNSLSNGLYLPGDTVTDSLGANTYALEVVGGHPVGCRILTCINSAAPTLSINSAAGAGAVLTASRTPDWTGTIDAMGDRFAARLGDLALLTSHGAVPVVDANANFDTNEIKVQSFRDCYSDPGPSWRARAFVTLQSAHNRTRPRASEPTNMAWKERKRSSPMPFIIQEPCYRKIPAGLPVDATAIALGTNPVQIMAGSRDVIVTFPGGGHGLTTPTDGGRQRSVYMSGLSAVGNVNPNGGNWPVSAIDSPTKLRATQPTIANDNGSGGGSDGTVKLRQEYFDSERIGAYDERRQAGLALAGGAMGLGESAQSLYGFYTGRPQNNKYLPEKLFSDRLDEADQNTTRILHLFAMQRPHSKGVTQVNFASTFMTVTNATPALWSRTAGAPDQDFPVALKTTGALPPNFAALTRYYANKKSGTTFTLSATVGGAEIAAGGAGSGSHTLIAAGFNSFIHHYSTNNGYFLNNVASAGNQNIAANATLGRVADDKSFAWVYSSSGKAFDLDLADNLTQGVLYSRYWLNPRDGSITDIGTITLTSAPADQVVTCTPPSAEAGIPASGGLSTLIDPGLDWVFVIERVGAYSPLSFV